MCSSDLPIVASRASPTRRPTGGEDQDHAPSPLDREQCVTRCNPLAKCWWFVDRQISSSASVIYQTGCPHYGIFHPPSPPVCVYALRSFSFSQILPLREQREVCVGKQYRVILAARQWLLTGAAARLGLETKFDLPEPDFCLRSHL